MRVGAYPGTFDPPTIAHLAVAEAAWRQGRLDRVHLVVSTAPLGKSPSVPTLEHRLSVLESVVVTRPWLEVKVSDRKLISEIAEGYDAVVMGADKWLQVIDEAWYGGSTAARDAALASLPLVLLADRHGRVVSEPLPEGCLRLAVDAGHDLVSSTEARQGRVEWMVPEAMAFDAATGAWTDPDRYLGRPLRKSEGGGD